MQKINMADSVILPLQWSYLETQKEKTLQK